MKKPDYIASSAVDLEDGKSRWREVGVAFKNAKTESITVLLDAMPLSGKIVLHQPKQREIENGEVVEF